MSRYTPAVEAALAELEAAIAELRSEWRFNGVTAETTEVEELKVRAFDVIALASTVRIAA